MSMSLFVAIEPREREIRLLASLPEKGVFLKARLDPHVVHSHALITLLEALALWHGRPVHAVLDAAAPDVQTRPERWARLLADANERHVEVRWVATPEPRPRDRFLGTLGRFRRASGLVAYAAGGVP